MKNRQLFQCITLFLGLTCMYIGYTQNQHTLTMAKAIRICLECIGIG